MNWPSRNRPAAPASTGRAASAAPARTPAGAAASPPGSADRPAPSSEISRRTSNGLKEMLSSLDGAERGEVLDLGPVSQATVDFFTSRGFRLHTQDLLRSWREFLAEELNRPVSPGGSVAGRAPATGSGAASPGDQDDPSLRPARFFARHLWYEPRKFHGVLLWDSLDYLDAATGSALVARLGEILRPGGVALLHLHDKTPERFWRYRVLETQTLECVPSAAPVVFQRVIANREIMNMFHDFRTSKTFVGRDQIREVMFLR
jgi:hypothetical protein